jgi:lysyl-tRNA synthetase, class II
MARLAERVTGSTRVRYQNQEVEFAGPWRRLGLYEALEQIGGADRSILSDRTRLLEFAGHRGVTLTKTGKTAKIITKLFDVLVQPHLIQPTFIHGYPAEVSPLSRRSDETPELTERFELFIGGREIANGFSELNDPADQRERFAEQLRQREAGDAEAHWMDDDYIEALEYGMPPTAGEGIGIDRLTMLLTNAASIREVILFPHMKPRE